MDSPSRDSWRTYGNGIATDSQSIQLTYPPSPPPQTDDVPLHTDTQLSEPVIVFGSPSSEELNELLNGTSTQHASKPASPSQQENNAPNNAALAGAGSGGGGAGGASRPNASGGGGSGASGGGGGGGGPNWNQLLNNYVNMVGSALNSSGTAATPAVPSAAGTPSPAAASIAPAHTARTTVTPAPVTSAPAAAPTPAHASKPQTPQDTPTVEFGSAVFTANETDYFAAISVNLSAKSSQTVTVQFNTKDGTAKSGVDYQAASYNVTFDPGSTNALLTVFLDDDGDVSEPSPVTVDMALSSPTNATLGDPSTAVLKITEDNDPPPDGIISGPVPPSCNRGCINEPGSVIQTSTASTGPAILTSSAAPVRYADGVVTLAETDLHSDGFGFPWGQTRSWTNSPGYTAGSDNGNGWVDTYTPHLIQADGSTDNSLIAIANGNTAFYYDLINGVYQPRFDDPSQLTYDSGTDTYTLIDGQGDKIVFNGFGSGWQPAQQGAMASYTDANGVTLAVKSYTSDGHVAEMQRSTTSGSDTITESWLYSYLPSTDPNVGLLSNVTLRTQVNGGRGPQYSKSPTPTMMARSSTAATPAT